MYLLYAGTGEKFGTSSCNILARQFVQLYLFFIFSSSISPPFWIYLHKVAVERPSLVCKCLIYILVWQLIPDICQLNLSIFLVKALLGPGPGS